MARQAHHLRPRRGRGPERDQHAQEHDQEHGHLDQVHDEDYDQERDQKRAEEHGYKHDQGHDQTIYILTSRRRQNTHAFETGYGNTTIKSNIS